MKHHESIGESTLYSIQVEEEGEGRKVQLVVLCGSIVAFTV